jgi:cytochrome c55X
MPRLLLITGLLLATITATAASTVSSERQDELKNLFHQDCGSCHGLTMAGGLGPSLQADALTGKPDEFLITTILEGRRGTAMPPWKTFISPDEAAWLVNYMRNVRK